MSNSFSAWTVFRRQNLTSADVRFWRLKTVPALKGLIWHSPELRTGHREEVHSQCWTRWTWVSLPGYKTRNTRHKNVRYTTMPTFHCAIMLKLTVALLVSWRVVHDMWLPISLYQCVIIDPVLIIDTVYAGVIWKDILKNAVWCEKKHSSSF